VYSLQHLTQAGLAPSIECHCNDEQLRLLWLRHNDVDEYKIGFSNFYVITRYNQSTHYAMAVHELAQAIKNAFSRANKG
jgi:membrane-bound lytic murein transglycosylase B